MYRSCSCLGYAAGFFQPHLCSQNNMPASGRRFHHGYRQAVNLHTVKVFCSEPHDCDTHHQWSEPHLRL